MLTVIVPYRAGQRREWTAERFENANVITARVTGGGKPVLVTFRKQGAGVSVETGK